MEKIKKTLISIGIFLASQIVVSTIFVIAGLMQGMDMKTAVNSTLGMALLISDLLTIILLLILKYCRFKELFKKVPADVLLISIVFALSGMYAVEFLSSAFEIPDKMAEQFQALAGTISGFLGVCIIGPVMEEMIMRRVILKEIAKATKSMWWGIIISSALFAIIHINPIQVVFAMPAGIFLGWIYCKTKSLLVPICIHIINNTIAFILMSMGYESQLSLDSTFGVILLIVLILISALSCIWIVRYYNRLKKELELQQAAEAEPAKEPVNGAFEGDSYDKSEGDSSSRKFVQ